MYIISFITYYNKRYNIINHIYIKHMYKFTFTSNIHTLEYTLVYLV